MAQTWKQAAHRTFLRDALEDLEFITGEYA